MIICTACGNHNEDDDEFCGSCGKFLEWVGEKVEEPPPPEPEPEPEPEPAKSGLIDRVRAAVGIEEAHREDAEAAGAQPPGAAQGSQGAALPETPAEAAEDASVPPASNGPAPHAAAPSAPDAGEVDAQRARAEREAAEREAAEAAQREAAERAAAEREAAEREAAERAVREATEAEEARRLAEEAARQAAREAEAAAAAQRAAEEAAAEQSRLEALQQAAADQAKRETEEAEAARQRAEAAAEDERSQLQAEQARAADAARQQAEAEARRQEQEAAAAERARRQAEDAARLAAAEAAAAEEEQRQREAAEAEAARLQAEAEAQAQREAEQAEAARREAEAAAAAEEQRRQAEEEAQRQAEEARQKEEAAKAEAARRAAALLAKPKSVRPTAAPAAPPPGRRPPPPAAPRAPGPPSDAEQPAAASHVEAEASGTLETPPAPPAAAVPVRPQAQTPVAQQPTKGKRPPRPAPKQKAPDQTAKPGDLICGQCGQGNDPQRKFCRKCGNSLAEAAPAAKLPWYKRIFGKKDKPAKAGSGKRGKTQAKELARSAQTAGWKANRALGMMRRALLMLLVIGVAVPFALPNLRATVFEKGGDALRWGKNILSPDFAPVNPLSASASSELPEHPATLAIDLGSNTYWSEGAPAEGIGESIAVEFDGAVDLSRVIITPGATEPPDQFLAQPRPRELRIVFDDGQPGPDGRAPIEPQTVQLEDEPTDQTFTLKNVKQVRKLTFFIVSVYKGQSGEATSIAELEFRRKVE